MTVTDIEKEGVQSTTDRIESAIELAQSYIEKMTGQWFELRSWTYKLDGERQDVVYLPVYAKTISEIRVNDVVLDADSYVVYNDIVSDIDVPKIKFNSKLSRGNRNIEITGEFGYVDSNYETPIQIKKICKKLALAEIGLLTDDSRKDIIDRGRIIEEETDGHRYRLAEMTAGMAFTGDSEIDIVLASYKMSPVDVI